MANQNMDFHNSDDQLNLNNLTDHNLTNNSKVNKTYKNNILTFINYF